LAKGEVFAFLDADDWWHPEKLQRQMEKLAQEPTLGYVLCHMQVVQEADAPWPVTLNQRHYQHDPPCHLPSALVVRRQRFEQVGGFDARYRYSDDTDWFLRAKDAGIPMALLPQPLVYKRIHQSNLSHTPAMTQETLRALRASVLRQRHRAATLGGSIL
jgi:glycosyltransferase involved in cell wall biosynthesis